MPRKKRDISQYDLYHIVLRGNNRDWIFKDNGHKDKVLSLIYDMVDSKLELYSWCVMSNHIHVLVRCELELLSIKVRKLSSSYAYYYQNITKSSGHVFQGRYLSEAINSFAYLLEVIRYIHNNPIAAKITKDLNTYKWCSYKWYLRMYSKRLKYDVVETYFNGGINNLIDYHKKINVYEILDIPEDRSRWCFEVILRVANEKRALYDRQSIVLTKTIEDLAFRTNIPVRKISDTLGVPYGEVQKICHAVREKKRTAKIKFDDQ